ncbi:PilW family protein [Paenibacillus cymbidii]|uniref:PilW family protein n=1 Tax=Paenibacillus cymbidii TaxID=1639034 RepID=UPI001081FEE1|nr:prepilin-type N-terminal cleavage/methylation domain-containing protein [Paenibacillus cymbidii]
MTRKRLFIRRLLRDNEEGMTLIEIMTALAILSMVTTILFSFLLMGVSMFKRISAESQIRNQGDALASRIIGELKDAVYVVKTADDRTTQIEYAKRESGGANPYVARFVMKIVDDGVEVTERSPTPSSPKKITMASAYKLDRFSSTISARDDTQTIKLNLVYGTVVPQSSSLPGGEQTYQITTKIPLVRSEGAVK